jgi:hypothetical protein
MKTNLVKAYKRLMADFEEERDVGRMEAEGMESMEDYYDQREMTEEQGRQEETVMRLIERCKRELRQRGELGRDEQMVASITAILADSSISVTPQVLDMILSILPEESSIGKEYDKRPIVAGTETMTLGMVGEVFKNCEVDLEDVDKSLLLDRKFMDGYIRSSSIGKDEVDRKYSDLKLSNRGIIDYVNKLCDDRGKREEH